MWNEYVEMYISCLLITPFLVKMRTREREGGTQIVGQTVFFNIGKTRSLGGGQQLIQTNFTSLKKKKWPCVTTCLRRRGWVNTLAYT